METVQLKLSLESLGEIYQLNHWKEVNSRRQPLSLLTSAQSGKSILAPKQPKDDIVMQPKEFLTNDMLIALFPIYINWQPDACLFPFLQHVEQSFSDMKLKKSPS